VEAVLVSLSGSGLDTDGSGESADDDPGDAAFLKAFCQVGVVESAPGVLGDRLVAGLLLEFREKVRPARSRRAPAGVPTTFEDFV